jgi:hypothetical protein
MAFKRLTGLAEILFALAIHLFLSASLGRL